MMRTIKIVSWNMSGAKIRASEAALQAAQERTAAYRQENPNFGIATGGFRSRYSSRPASSPFRALVEEVVGEETMDGNATEEDVQSNISEHIEMENLLLARSSSSQPSNNAAQGASTGATTSTPETAPAQAARQFMTMAEMTKEKIQQSFAESTIRSHAKVWRQYLQYHRVDKQAADPNFDPLARTIDTPHDIAEFMLKKCGEPGMKNSMGMIMGCEGNSISYAESIRSAISAYFINHYQCGPAEYAEKETGGWMGNPCRSYPVRNMLRALMKDKIALGIKSISVRALRIEELRALCRLPTTNSRLSKLDRARRNLIYLLCFLCFLRIDEALKICMTDIEWIRGGEAFRLTLRKRKTHQHGKVQPFVLKRNDVEPELCPVRALLRYNFYLQGAADSPNSGVNYDAYNGALFCYVTGSGIIDFNNAVTYPQFSTLFQQDMRLVDSKHCEQYGSHSFRRGAVQYFHCFAPLEERWSLKKLCEWGGWSTEFDNFTILRYIVGIQDGPEVPERENYFQVKLAQPPCWTCGQQIRRAPATNRTESVYDLQQAVRTLRERFANVLAQNSLTITIRGPDGENAQALVNIEREMDVQPVLAHLPIDMDDGKQIPSFKAPSTEALLTAIKDGKFKDYLAKRKALYACDDKKLPKGVKQQLHASRSTLSVHRRIGKEFVRRGEEAFRAKFTCPRTGKLVAIRELKKILQQRSTRLQNRLYEKELAKYTTNGIFAQELWERRFHNRKLKQTMTEGGIKRKLLQKRNRKLKRVLKAPGTSESQTTVSMDLDDLTDTDDEDEAGEHSGTDDDNNMNVDMTDDESDNVDSHTEHTLPLGQENL